MSKTKKGGTDMYCPSCRKIKVCASPSLSSIGHSSGQRWHHTEHSDLHWFRRARICLTCDEQFVTAEFSEKYLYELVELRNALSEVKQKAEQFVTKSKSATKSLDALSKSLDTLRALKIYRVQK
jgi:hypothetical protein